MEGQSLRRKSLETETHCSPLEGGKMREGKCGKCIEEGSGAPAGKADALVVVEVDVEAAEEIPEGTAEMVGT